VGVEKVSMISGVILGGALVMMGQHTRSESLFYYSRLEDQIPVPTRLAIRMF
jgi:hypothetical protein